MNIGLEVLNTPANVSVSAEDLFGQYVACEQLVAASESFFSYGDKLFTTFENICSLRATAKQFGSTEGMKVINDLVKDEFHGNCTIASLEANGEGVWAKIKAFFVKIGNWIKEFFYRVLNFFGGAENRLNKLAGQLAGMRKGKGAVSVAGGSVASGNRAQVSSSASGKDAVRPWSPLVPKEKVEIIVTELDKTVKACKTKRSAAKTNPTVAAAEQLVKDCEAQIASMKSISYGARNAEIKTIDASISYINGVIAAIKGLKDSKRDAELSYSEFKGLLDVTQNKNLIKEAQAWKKACAAEMKMYSTSLSIEMRVAAYTLAHCKAVK